MNCPVDFKRLVVLIGYCWPRILQSNYNWSEEIVHVAQALDEEDKRDATLPRLSGWLLMEAAEAVSLASTSSFHTCVKWTN